MLSRRFDLSGGMQIRSNKYLMAKNQVLRAQNVVGDTVGSFTKRKGYTQIGDQITASKNILMNTEFQFGTTPNRQHIVVCDGASNSEVYVNVGGVWTSQSQSLTVGAKARGTDFLDQFFLVNYEDATRSYSGTIWSTTVNVTSAPKAKFVESYRERLYLVNLDVNGTPYPSRFLPSSLPTATNTITWDHDNDKVDVETSDGDQLTGVTKNGGYLIFFKEDSMHRFDGAFGATSLKPISWKFGAVSQESIVSDENLTLFYSRKGLCIYNGGQPQLVSRPVQPIVDRVDQATLEDICIGIYENHCLCFVGNLTSPLPGDSTALTNVIIDYDISQNLTTYHTIADTARTFSPYVSGGARLLSFGDADGEMFTWDQGNTDDGTDIDTNIELVMWPSGPETNHTFQSIYFFGNEYLGDVDYQFAVDDGNNSTAVGLNNDYSKKNFADSIINPFGRELKVKISESGGVNQWRLDGLSVESVSAALEVQEF
jgi:hypothetical protein